MAQVIGEGFRWLTDEEARNFRVGIPVGEVSNLRYHNRMTEEPSPEEALLPKDPQLRDILQFNYHQNEHRARMDLLDKHRGFMREAITSALGLNQIIVALGYAAFLAVWSEMADKLNRDIVVLTGGFLILSLSVFIIFTLANVAILSANSLDYGTAVRTFPHLTPAEQGQALEGVTIRQGVRMGPLLVAWPFLFGFQVISGLTGAIILGVAAFGDVLGRLPH